MISLRKISRISLKSSKYFVRITQRNSSTSSVNSKAKKGVDLSGILPPIITPFDKEGVICYDRLKKNFDVWNKFPFSGYVVMGSNGEGVSLSFQEKYDLTAKVKQLARPGTIIIAGTGCVGTEETIEITTAIAETGIDAALVVTPYYYSRQMNSKVLRAHYEAVADKSPIPILLYNVPYYSGVDMDTDVCIQLADHPNIIGMKYSDNNILKISEIMMATKQKDFQVLGGSAGYLLPTFLMGSVGSVATLANVLGEEICQLHKLYKEGKLQEAKILQYRLMLPNDLVTRKYSVAGAKAAMKLKGLSPGYCRLPLLSLSQKEVEEIKQTFEKCGFPLTGKVTATP